MWKNKIMYEIRKGTKVRNTKEYEIRKSTKYERVRKYEIIANYIHYERNKGTISQGIEQIIGGGNKSQ